MTQRRPGPQNWVNRVGSLQLRARPLKTNTRSCSAICEVPSWCYIVPFQKRLRSATRLESVVLNPTAAELVCSASATDGSKFQTREPQHDDAAGAQQLASPAAAMQP